MMAAPETAQSVKPCSFVLIDDNPADIRWFEMMAREAERPCTVKTYRSVPEAVTDLAACQEPCDAVFITALPAMLSLEEAYAELTSLPNLTSVPVIALIDGSHDLEFITRAGLKRWV